MGYGTSFSLSLRRKSLAVFCGISICFHLDAVVLGGRVSTHRKGHFGGTVHGPMLICRDVAAWAQVRRVLHAQVSWEQVLVYGGISLLHFWFDFNANWRWRGCLVLLSLLLLLLLLQGRCRPRGAHLLT